ncbi:MAG: HlyD family efflux transporter periplasmic adaptor subunit, partial [Planctomycetota bacterium]
MNRIAGRGAAFVLPALAWLSACGEQPAPSTPSPRPVEAVVLERSDPSQRLRVPGIVRSWAEQDIAFEVAGRIGFVINEGEQVRGRWEEGGEVLVEGDVLARLDPAEFEAAVRAAEADLESALIQRDSAAPAELARAEARRVEASENLSRTETAFAQDAASELDFVRARAQFEVAEAEVAVARSGVRSASAAALRAEATLTQARLDLKNTEIRAPFGAEVSDRFEIVGGYATPGTRVLSLTMLDPIEIAVQVSAATARSIAPENLVRFYVGGIERPFSGKVLRKSTSADPGTQTFTITVIARNQ